MFVNRYKRRHLSPLCLKKVKCIFVSGNMRRNTLNTKELTLNSFFQLICLSLCNLGARNADIFQRDHASKQQVFEYLFSVFT